MPRVWLILVAVVGMGTASGVQIAKDFTLKLFVYQRESAPICGFISLSSFRVRSPTPTA
jgi:hypothetical protein